RVGQQAQAVLGQQDRKEQDPRKDEGDEEIGDERAPCEPALASGVGRCWCARHFARPPPTAALLRSDDRQNQLGAVLPDEDPAGTDTGRRHEGPPVAESHSLRVMSASVAERPRSLAGPAARNVMSRKTVMPAPPTVAGTATSTGARSGRGCRTRRDGCPARRRRSSLPCRGR